MALFVTFVSFAGGVFGFLLFTFAVGFFGFGR